MKDNKKTIDKQKSKLTLQKIDINIQISKNVTQISSIPIYSPFVLYQGQRMFIEYIIECLQKKQNALVQSPTGTGKTLSLLCSTLSWVRYQQQLGKQPTRIIYTSRTHAQLKQVVQQLNKTGFLLKLAILGSRDQTCINEDLKQLSGQGKQLQCRLRVMRKNNQFCKYFHHQDFYMKLNQFGKISDLQDIKSNGKIQGFCPFFYQKNCKNVANLILMPYTYLIEEKTSKAQQLSSLIQNSILIFDEAHNIPNVCQNSKQFTISLATLSRALHHLSDLRQLKLTQQKKMVSKKTTIVEEPIKLMKSTLHELEMHASFISTIHAHMQTLQISLEEGLVTSAYDFIQCLDNGTQSGQFGKINNKLKILIQSSVNISNDIMLKPYWSLQAWFSFLQRLTQMHLISKRQQQMSYFKTQICYNGSDIKINIFCLDPKIGFQRILKMKPLSIILTSGTLSPINSMPMQLQVQFNRPLACPHIMSKQQVNGCILTMGPNKIKLNFSYQNRDNIELYKQLGEVLTQIVSKTPNGVIIFVPSYNVLQRIKIKFTDLGIMAKLYAKKNIFFEKPNSTDFKKILDNYLTQATKQKGAILFALARGKISEGLDFADQKCRAVVMIGVPYPAAKDLKVTSKMEYLDLKSKTLKTINGNQWYICQTIRCINQSIGRIIRNKNDYGSIYLLDERFKKNQILSQISGWARQCLKIIDDFQEFKFKVQIFQQYFKNKNKQLQQVQHFFISQTGTKLTNKIQPNIKPTRNSISISYNQINNKTVQPYKQLMALKADLKQKQKAVGQKNQQQKKQPSRQKIIFGLKAKKTIPIGQTKQCPICRQERILIKNTECIHQVCQECWDIWLKKDLRCPICRVRVRQKYLIK